MLKIIERISHPDNGFDGQAFTHSRQSKDEDEGNLDTILPLTEDVSNKIEVTRPSASVVKNKNLKDKSALVVPVVPTQTEQGIEVVPQVVPSVVPQAVPSQIDWKTYPYDSNDPYTLKNRANKVKERIMGCATSNELNKLIFLGKVTEIERSLVSSRII